MEWNACINPQNSALKIFTDRLVSLSMREKNGSTASHLFKRTWEKLNKQYLEKFWKDYSKPINNILKDTFWPLQMSVLVYG